MTDQPPYDDAARAGRHLEHDLEYDLAHEAFDLRCIGPGHETQPEPKQHPMRTDDYDGDYGYDLAHDIPRRHRA